MSSKIKFVKHFSFIAAESFVYVYGCVAGYCVASKTLELNNSFFETKVNVILNCSNMENTQVKVAECPDTVQNSWTIWK